MKIALLTRHNTRDVKEWSGIPFYMANTFECLGVDIERIDCLPKSSKIVTKVYRIIQKVTKSYLYDERSFFTIWKTSKAAQLRIQNSDADLILTMQYPPISFLKTRKPIVFWNDSLFGNLLGYYDTMPVPPKWHLDEIYKLEKKAIEKSSAIVMCSAWARDNACKMYGVDPRKMHVIPYGANLSKSYNFPTNRILAYNETIHLLSVGYEWKRKGMDLSCQLARKLKNEGINCHLHIVCRTFDEGYVRDSNITFYGSLSKSNKQELDKLQELYSKAHFFLLPSRAECLGIVIAEANAHSVPVLASDAGGIPTAVNSPLGGHVFPLSNWVESAANVIIRFNQNPSSYTDAGHSALKNYKTHLTWEVGCKQILNIFRDILVANQE